jgi:hypothetical protein
MARDVTIFHLREFGLWQGRRAQNGQEFEFAFQIGVSEGLPIETGDILPGIFLETSGHQTLLQLDTFAIKRN